MGTWANNQTILEGLSTARLGLLAVCNCDSIVKKLWLRESGQPCLLIDTPTPTQIAVLSMDGSAQTVSHGTKQYQQIEVCGCIVCWEIAA